ncbi:hypothetical protein Sphch_2717 [Sphingobium chlorophenolicum L-1]|uniref:Uncharacterized protein n=1 Tax=Sphingobium chlorophenolicum L-1 TaxID=690566 RepID=F6F0N8_SPHCR|nr:hypothetical protein [Sphingobium chlorophenolicum]AEG50360.1 hypothetical protein Sphch_2717 [Sphingobium chlorophenolicum L-1]
MHIPYVKSGREPGRPLVKLGKARHQTRASMNEIAPELVGDKTQRFGG